jgi:hypothetical protein
LSLSSCSQTIHFPPNSVSPASRGTKRAQASSAVWVVQGAHAAQAQHDAAGTADPAEGKSSLKTVPSTPCPQGQQTPRKGSLARTSPLHATRSITARHDTTCKTRAHVVVQSVGGSWFVARPCRRYIVQSLFRPASGAVTVRRQLFRAAAAAPHRSSNTHSAAATRHNTHSNSSTARCDKHSTHTCCRLACSSIVPEVCQLLVL